MGCVDVGAKPCPGIGELDLGSAHSLRELRQGAGTDRDPLFELQWLGLVEAPVLEPLVEQVVVVIPRHEDDAPAGDNGVELLEEGTGALERLGQRPVAELDHVTKQHDLLGTLELGPERLADVRPAEEIDGPARAEMKVGEDDGAHTPILARRAAGWRPRGRLQIENDRLSSRCDVRGAGYGGCLPERDPG
jgi:hypothetical protein